MTSLNVTTPPSYPPIPPACLSLPAGSTVEHAVEAALARVGEKRREMEKRRRPAALSMRAAPCTHGGALAHPHRARARHARAHTRGVHARGRV